MNTKQFRHSLSPAVVVIVCLCLGAGCSQLSPGRASTMETAGENARAAQNTISEAESLLLKGDQASWQENMILAQDLARQAVSLYREGKVEQSKDAAVLVEFGDTLLLLGDSDLAAEAYALATRHAPSNAQYWLKLGRASALLGRNSMNPALEAFERCIESIGAEGEAQLAAEAHLGRGDVYWQYGLYELAEAAYGQSLGAVSDYAPARLAMVALHVRQGEVIPAAEKIEAMGLLEPRAGAMFERRLVEALDGMERDRMTFGDTAEGHLAYAKLLSRVRRIPQTLLALERSIDLDGENFIAWNMLGSLMVQIGNPERARIAFTRSLELKADQPYTQNALEALPAPEASGEKRFDQSEGEEVH